MSEAHYKRRAAELLKEVRQLRQEAKSTYQRGRKDGSANAIAGIYCALSDLGLDGAVWLSARMCASRTKKLPFNLPADIERIVRLEIIAELKKMKMSKATIAEAERNLAL
jgi:hypothetical protein